MLKFILIFILIIYLLGYLGKLFFRNWIRKMSDQNQNNYNSRKEGDVHINLNQQKEKKFNKEDGEYVDYEDVE